VLLLNEEGEMLSRTAKGTVFLLLIGLLLTSVAEAATLAAEGTWQRKFQRGVLNAALSPLEITNELALEKKREIKSGSGSFGWVIALGRGSWFAVLRAFSGVYDVVTFPLPLPSSYGPVYEPEFSLEYLGLLKKPS
jgi:putative exosortase-associated protein (TIGR04073 family)